jgi:hypothetical protein
MKTGADPAKLEGIVTVYTVSMKRGEVSIAVC